jgi:hypothetical protein
MCGWLELARPVCGSAQLVATGFNAATPLKCNVWVESEARGRNQHSRSRARLDLMLGFECVVGLSEPASLVARPNRSPQGLVLPRRPNAMFGSGGRGQHSRSTARLDLMLGIGSVVGSSGHTPLVAGRTINEL